MGRYTKFPVVSYPTDDVIGISANCSQVICFIAFSVFPADCASGLVRLCVCVHHLLEKWRNRGRMYRMPLSPSVIRFSGHV